MSVSEEAFLRMLRETFRVEAADQMQTIARGLLELEKAGGSEARRELVAEIFRAAHSLKGAARAVDLGKVEAACQALEDMFTAWKSIRPGREAFNQAHRRLDAIAAILGGLEAAPASPGAPAPAAAAVAPLAPVPAAGPRPPEAPSAPPVSEPRPAAEGTVRVSTAKLDARLLVAEEMLLAKQAMQQRVEDLRAVGGFFEVWRREWGGIEADVHLLRERIESHASLPEPGGAGGLPRRVVDFLGWNRDRLRELEARLLALTRAAEQDRYTIGRMVDDLLEDSKQLLLQPFGTVTASFPKLVRDLAEEQGKQVSLVIRGEDVEIDKRVLEEMKDPLIHLLRNGVDHGVEAPAERLAQGKPVRAALTISVASVNGSKIELVVSDDGAGIDTPRVRESAVQKGVLSREEAAQLDEHAAQALIFQPEVSTRKTVTHVSGRGLGMAIVRERTEKLGGTIAIESEPRRGTTFRFVLPAMLATFRGVIVEAAARRFVVPTFHVEHVSRVPAAEVKTVEGRETIALGGGALALVRLASVLELPPAAGPEEEPGCLLVVVLGAADHRLAFAVDAVHGEQEVLVKPFRRPLLHVRNLAGATLLGSGQVVPVLSVPDLLKSARRAGAVPARVAPLPRVATLTRSILVAEDSITSRTLIKGILEAAGYRVTTAVDGVDAFTLLRAGQFDLVVSDVEMPRLNGFELTRRIRGDRRLAELPVILVTALETREDRERGIDVGANAYVVKSRFDEGDLLQRIRQLIGNGSGAATS